MSALRAGGYGKNRLRGADFWLGFKVLVVTNFPKQNQCIEIIIAGSPPTSLPLIVGESKWDVPVFFFFFSLYRLT